MRKDQDIVTESPVQRLQDNDGRVGLIDRDHFIERRLAVIEERSRDMPTKVWVLGGVIAGIVAATPLALGLLRVFGQ